MTKTKRLRLCGLPFSAIAPVSEVNISQEASKVLLKTRKGLPEWSKRKMNDVMEAQALFKQAWPEWRFGGSVKAMVGEAYRFMSPLLAKPLTYRRVETIWQGKARRIDGEEKDVLRLAVTEEHFREQAELRARLAELDTRLASLDKETHRRKMAEIRAQKRRESA